MLSTFSNISISNLYVFSGEVSSQIFSSINAEVVFVATVEFCECFPYLGLLPFAKCMGCKYFLSVLTSFMI